MQVTSSTQAARVCPKCKQEASAKAGVCPSCGTRFHSRWGGCAIGCAAVIGLVFLVGLLGAVTGGPSATPTPEDPTWFDRARAVTACKEYTLTRLQAPSTAKFQDPCSVGDCRVGREMMTAKLSGEGNYQVMMWVEALNTYGVPIRTTVTCNVGLGQSTYLIRDWHAQ
jgi:hypothetical protein